MGIGALLSVASVYTVFTLALARLSYALAADGLFPRPFAWLHPRSRTPWVGLTVQAISPLALAQFGNLRGRIEMSVFFLGLCYVLTGLAALRLIVQAPARALHLPALRLLLVLAAIGGSYLVLQASPEHLVEGLATLAVGLAWYGGWGRRTQSAGERQAATPTSAWESEHAHLHAAWLWRSLRRRRHVEAS